jgi:hypothetical protein
MEPLIRPEKAAKLLSVTGTTRHQRVCERRLISVTRMDCHRRCRFTRAISNAGSEAWRTQREVAVNRSGTHLGISARSRRCLAGGVTNEARTVQDRTGRVRRNGW